MSDRNVYQVVTVCRDCERCQHDRAKPKDGYLWHDYKCTAAEVQIERTLDFVSGGLVPEDTRPYCRDVNEVGDCQYYSKRS